MQIWGEIVLWVIYGRKYSHNSGGTDALSTAG